MLSAVNLGSFFLMFYTSLSSLVDKVSFSSPFLNHDHRGMLYVPNFDIGGNAIVKQSFLRVTSDIPNQLGFVWSRMPLNTDSFSIIWKLRVSGDDPKKYGDYLALGIDLEPKMSLSKVENNMKNFVGIKVIVDTNPIDKLPGSTHYTISVLVSNGLENSNVNTRDIQGCNVSDMRLHEGRDDFNFLKSARIRIIYKAATHKLEVNVDAQNIGKWERCVHTTIASKNLSDQWPMKAHIGLIGSTGELSNNHDVLSVKVFDDPDEAIQLDQSEDSSENIDDYTVLIHHMEHELYDIYSELKQTLDKLYRQEHESEMRLAQIESQLSKQIFEKIEGELTALENSVKRKIDDAIVNKVGMIETKIGPDFGQGIEMHLESISGRWHVPFLILIIVVIGVVGIVVWQYFTLKQSHKYK